MSTNQGSFPTQKAVPSGSANITGGTIDGAVIGGTTPAAITGTTIEATTAVISSEIGQDTLSLLTIPAGPGTLATTANVAAAKVGGTVTIAGIGSIAATIVANDFVGPYSSSGSTNPDPALVQPCIFEVAGTLKNIRVQSLNDATSSTAVTIYKSAGGNSFSYSATALTCTVASGSKSATDTNGAHAVSINAGDCVLALFGASWALTGISVTGQFIPAAA